MYGTYNTGTHRVETQPWNLRLGALLPTIFVIVGSNLFASVHSPGLHCTVVFLHVHSVSPLHVAFLPSWLRTGCLLATSLW